MSQVKLRESASSSSSSRDNKNSSSKTNKNFINAFYNRMLVFIRTQVMSFSKIKIPAAQGRMLTQSMKVCDILSEEQHPASF